MMPALLADAGPRAVDLLAALALKSSVVFLAAAAAERAFARGSAAARHAVWTIAVAAWLALPVVELAAPPLPARVPLGLGSALLSRPAHPVPAMAIDAEVARPSSETRPAPAPPVAGSPTRSAQEVPPVVPPRDPIPWTALILAIWAAGAASVLAFFALGRVFLARTARNAHPVEDPAWRTLLKELRDRLGVRRPVRLLAGDDAVAPITWGMRHPVILLPRGAASWSAAQRIAFLVHELAHVRRFDCAIQDAAHLACALHWFHPGVWFAARRLRIERERACDDFVLREGIGAADYARQLVDLVRSGRRPDRVLALSGATMARRSQLESRVRAILDAALDRRRVSPRRALIASGIAAALVVPLGALELTASASREASVPAEPAAVASRVKRATPAEPVSGGSLAERWHTALAYGRRESGPFWIAYAIGFRGGIDGRETLVSDSDGWNTKELELGRRLGSLGDRFGVSDGDAVFLFRFPARGSRSDFNRVAIRTARLALDFGNRPVLWLGRVSAEESLDWLSQLFRATPDGSRAQVLVTAISLHDAPGTQPLLEKIIEGSRGGDLRAEAAEGLARHPGPESLAALMRHARRDRVLQVRVESAEAIGDIRYAPATDALIELAQRADDERVRVEAVESLAAREPDRVVTVLESIANSDPSETVQMEATETLGDLPGRKGWAALRRIAANHPNRDVRSEAFETLGEKARGANEDSDVEAPEGPDRDSSPGGGSGRDVGFERYRTTDDVEALGERTDGESVRLLRVLALGHPDPELRVEAIEALGHKHPAQALLTLHRAALSDPDANVRSEAIESLGELAQGTGLAVLEELARHGPDSAAQAEALETLAQKAPDRALALLDRWIAAR